MKHFSPVLVTGALFCAGIGYGQGSVEDSPKDQLFDRIYGAVAGAYVGNAMGVPVEGWTWEKIEKTYGFIDKLMGNPRLKDGPGWTEDGMERYKIMCSAIIKKGGRITIDELAKEWVQDIDPNKIGYRIGGQCVRRRTVQHFGLWGAQRCLGTVHRCDTQCHPGGQSRRRRYSLHSSR